MIHSCKTQEQGWKSLWVLPPQDILFRRCLSRCGWWNDLRWVEKRELLKLLEPIGFRAVLEVCTFSSVLGAKCPPFLVDGFVSCGDFSNGFLARQVPRGYAFSSVLILWDSIFKSISMKMILEGYFLLLLLENRRLHALIIYTLLNFCYCLVTLSPWGNLLGTNLFRFRINFPL